jgi:hypothetical protein
VDSTRYSNIVEQDNIPSMDNKMGCLISHITSHRALEAVKYINFKRLLSALLTRCLNMP